MQYRLEMFVIPVSDVDRAKAFYDQCGFHCDVDHDGGEHFRVVQYTPPGSACSITFGRGMPVKADPGQYSGMHLVVTDIEAVAHHAGAAGTDRGTGGMATKLRAARIATAAGIETIVLGGGGAGLEALARGEDRGTRFLAARQRVATAERRWQEHHALNSGQIEQPRHHRRPAVDLEKGGRVGRDARARRRG